ncbi:ORF40-like protein [Bufonid herpesvirus 1]|uniref:ORF40-like protein n=1 Tax=Bufonid herpesvirus 1 TaxID=2282206 RepID=UPI000EB72D12|nr:ORF40-like protein [Bufonid herpesvirus 1]AXF48611.1 ORF40-like protein [Bufonid herpesvirus 1]
MATWVFITGTPGLGKTTAMRQALTNNTNVFMVNEGMDTGGADPKAMLTSQGRVLWTLNRMQNLLAASMADINKPVVRYFDRLPTCGFLFSRAVATLENASIEPNCPFLGMDFIVTKTFELLKLCTEDGKRKIHVVIGLFDPSADFEELVNRINERGNFDKNMYLPSVLKHINSCFETYANALIGKKDLHNIYVSKLYTKATDYFEIPESIKPHNLL